MSMMEWRALEVEVGEWTFSIITSSGVSNMLQARRNCFLGRMRGFEDRRVCPIGDPLRTEMLNDCFSFGGGAIIVKGGLSSEARFACGGELPKQSPRDIVDDKLLFAAPNLNGCSGTWFFSRCGTEVDEYALCLFTDGLSKFGLFFLLARPMVSTTMERRNEYQD